MFVPCPCYFVCSRLITPILSFTCNYVFTVTYIGILQCGVRSSTLELIDSIASEPGVSYEPLQNLPHLKNTSNCLVLEHDFVMMCLYGMVFCRCTLEFISGNSCLFCCSFLAPAYPDGVLES